MRSNHGATRAQLAKLLRLMHADKVTMHVLRHCIEGERLDLDEEQQSRVMREIFDVRTSAGQAKAEGLLRAVQQQERLPADLQQASGSKQADKLARAIWDAYLKQRSSKSRVLVMGRLARALSRSLAALSDSCMVVLGDTTLDRLSDMGQQVQVLLLPAPQDVASEPQIASQELFDLLLVAEPMGYLDVGEYAEKLRPFIRRRELEDEKVADQVQCLVIEARERLEDARDELFSAGYYLADHVEAFPKLRRAAAEDGRAVTLLSLPSAEKELLKRSAQDKALERKSRRLREDEDRAQLEEDEQQQRNLLHATLFDPLLLDPLLLDPEAPVARCEVAYELGASKDEAEVVVFWLHGNNEDAEVWRPHLFVSPVEAGVGEGSSGRRLRVVAAIPPEGHQQWFQCSDEDAVRRGMEWYEMSDGPTEEAVAKARADAARNVSFGKPSLEELRCLQEIELCCKQLLRLIDDEVGPRTSKVVLGGFSQGGSVAAYLALSGIASAEMQQRFQALVICCSGVPVFHFLASKMQVGCLAARDEADARIDFPTVHMIYGRDDPEVKDSFVQTISDLCKRFDFPTVVQRFDRDENEERFPARARRQMLEEVLRLVIAAD
ncbi:unnamed protein product [Polarella glacialis]|uniref:Serine hydrolase domain-containing protein n=1 Tax=Polarella glacialis TaxID=89957 RepID=A0A813DUB5_POLGL|nr:unnamed protein product [Polarella glacialis]